MRPKRYPSFVNRVNVGRHLCIPLLGNMSDLFSARDKQKLREAVEVCAPDFRYASREKVRKIVCAIKIPYPLLKIWNSLVKNECDGHGRDFVQEPLHSVATPVAVATGMSYIDLLEHCIPSCLFAFSDDVDVRKSINNNLTKIADIVAQLYKKTRGRARMQLDNHSRKFNVFEGQTKPLKQLEADVQRLKTELENWKVKYDNLEEAKKELYKEMTREIEIRDTFIKEQNNINKHLHDYIELLEKREGIAYGGKAISDVRNKSRSLKQFLSRVQSALWFSKNFGLEIKSIKVQEKDTGKEHELHSQKLESELNIDEIPEMCDSHQTHARFASLPNSEKEKIEQILFLLDKFCVGDSFFHELTMVVDGLPKSYLVKQARNELNSLCHLEKLPGMNNGVKVSSLDSLLRTHIVEFLEKNPSFDIETDQIQIKLSGDGARMTRNSTFILLSFSILQTGECVMSAKGNRTIAVVSGHEDYDVIKESFGGIFEEINNLIAEGHLEVGGKHVNTEFFLGGDYKFILMMLGLKSATSNYACAWCKVHKTERWNVNFDIDHYNSPPLKRTLQEVKDMSKSTHDNYCCSKYPLLNIELDHIIVDELHLLLRITDVLTTNLIDEVLTWDQEDDFDKTNKEQKGKHLRKLIDAVRSCGITFDVWQQKNADGKVSGTYDYTSLLGSDKKILLAELPNKLDEVLRPSMKDTVIDVWKLFADVYKIITTWIPKTNPVELWTIAKSWINLFLSLNGKREGYEKHRVTPYMHIMVAHLPNFLKLYKSVKKFTGQGVEKNNDTARSVVLRKSNKWDSVGDVLKVEHRQWELRMREREARKYEKKNDKYWTEEIKVARKKRREPVTVTQMVECDEDQDIMASPQYITLAVEPKKMKLYELKEELKKRGVRGYSKKRRADLIELLENEITR